MKAKILFFRKKVEIRKTVDRYMNLYRCGILLCEATVIQSHHMGHLVATLELSILSHGFHQQMVFAQLSLNFQISIFLRPFRLKVLT